MRRDQDERQRREDELQSKAVMDIIAGINGIAKKALAANNGFKSFEGVVAKACEQAASLASKLNVTGTNNSTRFLVLGPESCAKSTVIGAMCGKNLVHTASSTATRCFVTYDCTRSNPDDEPVYEIMDEDDKKAARRISCRNVAELQSRQTAKMEEIRVKFANQQGMSKQVLEVKCQCSDVRNMLITDGPGITFAKPKMAARIMKMYAQLIADDLKEGIVVVPIIMREFPLSGTGNDQAVAQILEGMNKQGCDIGAMDPVFLCTKADMITQQLMVLNDDSIQERFQGMWKSSAVRWDPRVNKMSDPGPADALVHPTFAAALCFPGAPTPADEVKPMTPAEKDEFYRTRVDVEEGFYERNKFRAKMENINVIDPISGRKYAVNDYIGFNAFGTALYARKMGPGLRRMAQVVHDVEAKMNELIQATAEPDLDKYTDWENMSDADAALQLLRMRSALGDYCAQQWIDMNQITTVPGLKWDHSKYGLSFDVTMARMMEWLEHGKGKHLHVYIDQDNKKPAWQSYQKAIAMNGEENVGGWEVQKSDPETAEWLRAATNGNCLRDLVAAAEQNKFLNTLKDVVDPQTGNTKGRFFSTAAIQRADKHFAFLVGFMKRAWCSDDELADEGRYQGFLINISSQMTYAQKKGMGRWIWPACWYVIYCTFLYMRMAEIVQKTVKDRKEEFKELYDEYGDLLDHLVHRPLDRVIFDYCEKSIEMIVQFCTDMRAAGSDPVSEMNIMYQIGKTMNSSDRFVDYMKHPTAVDLVAIAKLTTPRYRVGQPISDRVISEAYKSVDKCDGHTNFDFGVWRRHADGEEAQGWLVNDDDLPDRILKPFVALADTADGPFGDQANRVIIGVVEAREVPPPKDSKPRELLLYRVGTHSSKDGDVRVRIPARAVGRAAHELVMNYLVRRHKNDKMSIPMFASFDSRLENVDQPLFEQPPVEKETEGGQNDGGGGFMSWMNSSGANGDSSPPAEEKRDNKHEITQILDRCFGTEDTAKLNDSILEEPKGKESMRFQIRRILNAEHAEENVPEMVRECRSRVALKEMEQIDTVRVMADIAFDLARPLFKSRVQDIKKKYLAEKLEKGPNPIKLGKDEKAKAMVQDFFEKDIDLYRKCMAADAAQSTSSVKNPASTFAFTLTEKIKQTFIGHLEETYEQNEHVINCLEDITQANMAEYVRNKKEGKKTKEETERIDRDRRQLQHFRGYKKSLYQAIIKMGQKYEVISENVVS